MVDFDIVAWTYTAPRRFLAKPRGNGPRPGVGCPLLDPYAKTLGRVEQVYEDGSVRIHIPDFAKRGLLELRAHLLARRVSIWFDKGSLVLRSCPPPKPAHLR